MKFRKYFVTLMAAAMAAGMLSGVAVNSEEYSGDQITPCLSLCQVLRKTMETK